MSETSIFSYVYSGTRKNVINGALFREITDFNLEAPCLDTGVMLKYIFRVYRFNDYLYITDVFPAKWENEKDCFKRILSHEGNRINMKQLSITCLTAFREYYIKRDKTAAMVISGSYQYGEDDGNVSRKLRLYWAFFEPLLETLSLRAVQIRELNAFILTDKDNSMENLRIIEDYRTFRKQQNSTE